MSSNSRITRSKGLSDGTSLPPHTRPRKDMSTKADSTESMMTPTQQQTASDQLNNTVGHSPFARPSSWAGTSTMHANASQPPRSPFARPGSRAGSNTGLTDNIQGSPLSSVNSEVFPRDNRSASLDLIDADLDAEVANLAGQQKQPQTPLPSTSGVKTNSQVLFQPIFPAYVTPVQHRDQVLFTSSLNLINDSPRPQTLGSTARKPQPPAPHVKMPPTPYVNQATVNQHMNGQPTQPHGIPAGMGNPQQQQPPSVGTPLCPTIAQPAPLPFFQNSPVDTTTKSKNGQGVKSPRACQQTNWTSPVGDASNLDTSNVTVPCHRSVSSADRKAIFHIIAHSRTTGTPRQILKYRLQWTISSPTLGTNASTVGVNTNLQHVQ